MNQTITLPFDVALPSVRELRAGRLTCLYELGNLRTVFMDGVEVIRMIYSAVRDQQWATAPYTIENETIKTTEQTFSIAYTAVYELNNIRYKADFEITGAEDNTITFSMRGEALSDFKRNRIGICVLHPIEACAGEAVMVVKQDGTSYNAAFPESISPHQPFLDVQQIHFHISGAELTLQFEGDVFETEDQRNWTDSSFKTYSTPLAQPFPVEVKRGETIEQKITLAVSGEASAKSNTTAGNSDQRSPVPHIGFSREPGSPMLDEQTIGLLKKVPFHHYRVELHLDDTTWQKELHRGAAEAIGLGALLELIVFFSTAASGEVQTLITELKKVDTQLFSILILQSEAKATPQALMEKSYPVLKQTFSNIPIGWGTDGNFAELNRNRPGETPHDFVSFPLYPQVHASDLRSIIENLESQHHTLNTIRTFTQQPVHLSPITFAGRHVESTDARQQTSFAAWWTLKALHNLSAARSLTFYDITGPNGLLQPERESNDLKPTPIYDVFVQLKAFAPAWVIQKVGAALIHEPVIFENDKGERLQFVLDSMGV